LNNYIKSLLISRATW